MNIDETLKELKPYVTGVRYANDLTIVDSSFKPKWVVPPSQIISVERGKNNYYMFYSEKSDIGFDEILGYVRSVIKHNLEREETQELYKVNVIKLREFFKNHKLSELKNLSFNIGIDDDISSNEVEDWDLVIPTTPEVIKEEPVKVEKKVIKEQPPKVTQGSNRSVDKPITTEIIQGEPPKITEIEGEFEKINLPDLDIELPPRRGAGKVIIEEPELPEIKVVCKCGPNDVCPICSESKGM